MNIQNEIIDAISVLVEATKKDTTSIYMGVVSTVVGNKCVVELHGKEYTIPYYNGVPIVGEKTPIFVPNNNMSLAFVIGGGSVPPSATGVSF